MNNRNKEINQLKESLKQLYSSKFDRGVDLDKFIEDKIQSAIDRGSLNYLINYVKRMNVK